MTDKHIEDDNFCILLKLMINRHTTAFISDNPISDIDLDFIATALYPYSAEFKMECSNFEF